MTRRNIAILGSTGSIGTQTLDICAEYPELLRPYLLTAHRNVKLLAEQARRFNPKRVIIADESCYPALRELLKDTDVEVAAGARSIADAMSDDAIDTVVTAMVGYSGLEPTIAAASHGKVIALSNKETLVVAGSLISSLAKKHGAPIRPVDSEHSAIFQCLSGESHESIDRLILTASGGPFRTLTKEQMLDVTKADALRHPNWDMGAKVTIDSASMMNKGFEIMEARWLFDIPADRIDVAVHPQSIVHSMVQFVDGSVKAQLGLPDMHLPIRYALGFPDRLPSDCRKMRISDYANLTFEEPDLERFPMLRLAYDAIARGGNAPCALNAANEIAVAAFLEEKIRFVDIPTIVNRAVASATYIAEPSYDDLVGTNADVRQLALRLITNE